MSLSAMPRGGLLALCIAVLLASGALSGCKTHRQKADQKSSPEVLYKRAHKSLDSYDFNGAIKTYEQLTARFPFTDEARQARLDLIYAYYRAGENESATDAAETFIRENPTHPRVDYAWYIKGLVEFDKPPNILESLFHVDLSQRPPSNARKSFAAFKTVVEQYPKSAYAYDARQRMVYLRNRLAGYELNVARYYLKRGAWIAAAQRARNVVNDYPGAPATREALEIMAGAYDHLNLAPLAEQARTVYRANFGGEIRAAQADARRPWWKVW